MSKNILKKFAAVLLMVMIPVALFAIPVTISWEWEKTDAGVNYFRYQLGGEEDGKWNVVQDSVTAYTITGVESDQAYTLFLQQSYDGIYWSTSAQSTAYPAVFIGSVMTVPVASQTTPVVPTVTTEEPAPTVVETTPVTPIEVPVTEPVDTVPAEEKPSANKPGFEFQLTAGGAYLVAWGPDAPAYNVGATGNNFDADSTPLSVGYSGAFMYNNLFAFGKNFGIGLKLDIGYQLYTRLTFAKVLFDQFDNSDMFEIIQATLTPKFDISFNNGTVLSLEGGAQALLSLYNWNATDLDPGSYDENSANLYGFDWALVGGLGVSHKFNNFMSIGILARYQYIWGYRHQVDARITLGFHF